MVASVQELIAAANAKAGESPLIGLAKALAGGVSSYQAAQEDALNQKVKSTQVAQLIEQAKNNKANLDAMNARLGGANPIGPDQKFEETFTQGKEGVTRTIRILDNKPSDVTFNKVQLDAIKSGDTQKLADAFPTGVPPRATELALSGMRVENTQDERAMKHKEARSKERTVIVDKFNADASVKKAQQAIDFSNNIVEFATSDNPIAAAAIPTFMARASGEVGNLSEADKAPFGGSRAIISRLEASATQAANGKLTEENKKFITQLAQIMQDRSKENIKDLAKKRSKQYSKASDFLSENDIYSSLNPEDDGINQNTNAPAGKNVLVPGMTRITASDGSVHDIPTKNLEKAKQRDPGLKVMQ